MEESKPLNTRYLEPSQIEAIKAELETMSDNLDGFARLLATIDNLVRSNGTADGEYDAIFTLVTTLDLMQSSQMDYDAVVKSTYPILSAISFYDYLLVTGVLSAEDVRRFKDANIYSFNSGNGPAKA